MTAPALLIVADDLTGACDTAGVVAGLAGPVTVHLARSDPSAAGAITAVDLDSRAAPVAVAVNRTVDTVAAATGDVYLKIDSTLRGHVVATVMAAADAFRARHPGASVVVCPAFPARGRTVRARRVLVDGQELASTVLDELAQLAGLDVADAESEADLAALAVADGPTLWVGSAGLVPHVVRHVVSRHVVVRPATEHHHVAVGEPAGSRTVAVIVGSEQPASVAGAAALAERGDPRITVLAGDPRRPEFATAAAQLAASSDALVVTGGYTARRVFDRLAIAAVRVEGELEPGIPWASTGTTPATVVTKAGGFGDADTLGRLVDRVLRAPESA